MAAVKRRMTGLAVLALAGAMAVTGQAAAQSDDYTVPIRTEMVLPSPETLRVTYRMDRPIRILALARVPDGQRVERWQADDDDFELVHAAGRDMVRRRDGAPFREISFLVPATYTDLPKDYAPFMPFQDGGLLIHSGRFQACVRQCDYFPGAPVYPMSLTPPQGARLILDGEVIEGAAAWGDTRNGTMVYVGNAEPIETDRLVAVIDPGLPQDIRRALDEFFPELMIYFSERLGTLAQKPMLFAALDRYAEPDGNPRSNAYSSQGGTLPDQVFMHLRGDGWFEDETVRGEQTTGFLAWFFAHEAGHLYQQQDEAPFTMETAWIHEGGADAFAALAVSELDAVPEDYVSARIGTAIDDCLAGLAEGPLRNATDNQGFALSYSCGMIMQLAADRALREKSGGEQDLYDLWSSFLTDVHDNHAPWEEATFLSLMGRMAGGDAQALALDMLKADPTVTRDRLAAALGQPDRADD